MRQTRDGHIRRSGFSMLELVISMLIMAILAAVAIPRISSRLDDYRAQAAAERVAADLKLAADYARTHGTTETVTFSTDRNLYSCSTIGDPDNSDTIYQVILSDPPYSAELTGIWEVDAGGAGGGGPPSISFSGWGFPSSDFVIRVSSGDQARTVRVTAASCAVEVEGGS